MCGRPLSHHHFRLHSHSLTSSGLSMVLSPSTLFLTSVNQDSASRWVTQGASSTHSPPPPQEQLIKVILKNKRKHSTALQTTLRAYTKGECYPSKKTYEELGLGFHGRVSAQHAQGARVDPTLKNKIQTNKNTENKTATKDNRLDLRTLPHSPRQEGSTTPGIWNQRQGRPLQAAHSSGYRRQACSPGSYSLGGQKLPRRRKQRCQQAVSSAS